MKKLTLLVLLALFINVTFSNGLLTNTNQSAQFIRMMSRNASLGIDAAYYNPAGLIKLEDGWHFSINSQFLISTKTINTEFPLLNDGYYEGETTVPVFPSGFAVYKNRNWAFSFGFGPNAGGGTAVYERGIPTFEIPISKYAAGLETLAPLLDQVGFPVASGYNADLYFEGSSISWGLQLGATYKVSDVFSAYLGARYVPATNTYFGTIEEISVETSEGPMLAENYMELIDPVLNQTTGILDIGIGEAGNSDPEAIISDPVVIQIMTLLGNPDATNQEAVDIMTSTKGSVETLQTTDVSDKTVDVEQTGSFFTGIVGVNISPNEFLNIGLRYENRTFLTVTEDVTIDEVDRFKDGAIRRNDIPGIISAGIGITDNDWFEVQLSFNYYLDEYQSWLENIRNGEISEIEHNSFDIALGGQLNLTETFSLSTGVMYQKAGVADNFNSDFRFATPSYVALGGGLMWKITDELTLDAGVSAIFYQDAEVVYDDPHIGASYNETYGKETLSFALGLSYTIPY